MTLGILVIKAYMVIMKRGLNMNKRINVWLDEEEIKFIEWFAKRDNVSFMREMQQMFQTELDQCRRLYEDEMKMELNN